MCQRRVVVTGLGVVSPVGNDVATAWDNLVQGRTGIGRLTRFECPELASQVTGEIKGFDPAERIDKKLLRRTDPFVQYALAASLEAVARAGLAITEANAHRVAVVYGSGIGGVTAWDQNFLTFLERGPNRVSPFLVPMLIGNMASGMVSIELGATGPSKSIQTACATSAHAAGDAYRLIQRGEADVVVTGGSEAPLTALCCAGFCAMKALSCRNDDPAGASRPFDAERDGFVIAEGAATLVFEELEHARARGAEILAEVVGYGQSSDAYHMAAPHPCGLGAAVAMRQALAEARLNPAQIGYINAHATSTPAGDVAEVNAIRQLYANGDLPPVSSTKSMTGHMLGAAGAMELMVCILALRDGLLPPTINYTTPDPECLLDCVPNTAREARLEAAMSNSFGFGGHNCALIVKRY